MPNLKDLQSRFRSVLLNQRVVLPIAVFLLVLNAMGSTYAYRAFRDAARFRDQLIIRKYEGSLTEDLGFMTTLTAEIDIPPEKPETVEQIHSSLLEVREIIGNINLASSSPDPGLPGLPINATDLFALLEDPGRLARLGPGDFGLEPYIDPHFPDFPCVRSDDGGHPSFVFVPAPLVETLDTGADLPYSVKRQLVLSMLVEPYLLRLAQDLADANIKHIYYIPFTGFIRIHAPGAQDQFRRYQNAFLPVRSFSDRTYYRETKIEKGKVFRASEPYLDVAGSGVVTTYSIQLYNEALGLVGMIGVDRWHELESSSWEEFRLGLKPFRDFAYGKLKSDTPDSEVPAALLKAIRNSPTEFHEDIRRIEDGDATIFTAPIGDRSIAYYIFRPEAVERKYDILGLAYLGSMAGLLLISFLILYFQRATIFSRRRQEAIIENLNSGFLIVDDKEVIRHANEKFRQLAEVKELETRPLERYLTQESLTEYRQHAPGGGFEFPGAIKNKDGARSPVIISSAPLGQEAPGSRMLIMIPSAELELTIAKKFLHIFSHALKTPVHNMVMIADHFRRRKAFKKFDHYFTLMQNKSKEFTSLVDDVLRFSELDIKHLKPKRQPLNVAQVLRSVLSSVRERAASEGLKLTDNIPESLRTVSDEELLRVVFNNLVDNSLKYTDEGEVSVHAQHRGSDIVVTVSDTGPGVPPKDQEAIFDLFFQGKSRAGVGKRGLGLGLYISRRYIELLDGSLSYELIGEFTDSDSKVATGSRFIVRLPKTNGAYRDE